MTHHSKNLSQDAFATFSVCDGPADHWINPDHGTVEARFIMNGVYVALVYDQTLCANIEQQECHIYEELKFKPQHFPSRCFVS